MPTVESRVKAGINKVLDAFGVYYFMPVQMGLGKAGLDYHCVMRFGDHALAFFIEAKKPDEEPTPRQDTFADDRRKQQAARTFVIDYDPKTKQGKRTTAELVEFLGRMKEFNERYRLAPPTH
jgi:hypothetical protein